MGSHAGSTLALIEKPGKDPTRLENLQDIWNSYHGWKLITICLNAEYLRVQDQVVSGSQVGFTPDMNRKIF